MGTPQPNPSDRRVQRTRRTLRTAMISLILERGWEGFSVQDLCERADVGRSTFYTHFGDKEDLLIGGFDDLRKSLRPLIASQAKADDPLPFARGMIEHAFEQQRLFRALVGKRGGQVVLKRFRELIIDLVREDLTRWGLGGADKEPAVHFLAGGFLEVLTWWLESRTPMPPDELELLFEKMASPVLAGLKASRRRS